MDRVDGEAAGSRGCERRHEVGGSDGNEALDAGGQPDDTNPAQVLFRGHAETRKRHAEERMAGINDLNLLGWWDADANRGSVLRG